jgi:hypothetical protein
MACFLVPMTLGIITTIMRKTFPKKLHIDWLNMILWGGVIMLVVEHIAHGEIVPYPPFLTAGMSEILPEMLAVGIPMAVFCTSTWTGIVVINEALIKEKMKVKIEDRRSFRLKMSE